MALKLIANYSKRLGLPGYSSHQFSVSVETEITNVNDVAGEASRLYLTLQKSVDSEIQQTGFVPSEGYGTADVLEKGRSGHPGVSSGASGNGIWKCSDKQKDLILKLMDEHSLAKADVQNLAREMFGASEVSGLNKLQASGLIDRLIEDNGGKPPRRGTTPRYSNGRSR